MPEPGPTFPEPALLFRASSKDGCDQACDTDSTLRPLWDCNF